MDDIVNLASRYDGAGSSQNEVTKSDRKRKRKVLSCIACRSRKLKCDRNYPACTRCRKAGHADQCTYKDFDASAGGSKAPHSAPSTAGNSARDLPTPSSSISKSASQQPVALVHQDTRQDQAKRIAYLERKIALLESRQVHAATRHGPGNQLDISIADDPSTCEIYHALSDEHANAEPMIFRGKEFKTLYCGPSNPFSTTNFNPELRRFMKTSVNNHPAIMSIDAELKGILTRQKRAKKGLRNEFTDEQGLFVLLPDKAVLDQYVLRYFETFETTYRILHRPLFIRDYQNLWIAGVEAKQGTLVIVLLIVAILRCSWEVDAIRFSGYNTIEREHAVKVIETCESWLQQQSQKHLTLVTMQVHCLLFLAKQINMWKRKRLWTSAGNLIRFGMSAGLHRSSDLLKKKISVFAQEMRRRLWATMVELELQESIDRGMPATSSGFPFDCGLPTNIDDEDISEDEVEPPTSIDSATFTATSYLRTSQQSLPLRSSLNTLVNVSGENLTYSDVMTYDERLRKYIATIPEWRIMDGVANDVEGDKDMEVGVDGEITSRLSTAARAFESGLSAPDPDISLERPANTRVASAKQCNTASPLMAKSLLELQLQQLLILLHGPFAQRAGENAQYQGAMLACYEAAHRMIMLHSKLTATGNVLLGLLRHDVIRAAFSMCNNIVVSSSLSVSVCLQRLASTFLPTVEESLSLLENKVMRSGTNVHSYYFLASTCALMRAKLPDTKDRVDPVEDACGRLSKLFYKVIALQDKSDVTKNGEQMSLQNQSENYQPFASMDFFGWNLDDLWNLDFNVT